MIEGRSWKVEVGRKSYSIFHIPYSKPLNGGVHG